MRVQLYDLFFTEFYRTRKNYSVGISEKEKFRTYKTDVTLSHPSDITVSSDFALRLYDGMNFSFLRDFFNSSNGDFSKSVAFRLTNRPN